MPRPQPLQFIAIILVLWLQLFIYISYADVGTAAWYAPPYLPTACYGNDQTQFPTSNLFGAAGDGVWDNGASCGRQYLVRCISASEPNTCLSGVTIQIKIVEYALQSASQPSDSGTTVVLSQAAFAAITNSSSTASSVNIEFQHKSKGLSLEEGMQRLIVSKTKTVCSSWGYE